MKTQQVDEQLLTVFGWRKKLPGKKWHKSPHNRFKTLLQNTTQEQKIFNRSHSRSCQEATSKWLMLLTAIALCSLATLAASQQYVTSHEEEVDLLASSMRSSTSRANKLSRPHIYRLRAAPFNGRLSTSSLQVNGEAFGARAKPEPSEGCNQTGNGKLEELTASSIATSSQTLRLTPSATRALPVGGSRSGAGRELALEEPLELGASASKSQPTLINADKLTEKSSSAIRPSSQSTSSSQMESILSLIDEYDSKIATNRTKAQLSCDSGEMILRLNFSEAFKGIVYPDHNRLSPCRFFGDGRHNYELRLPLRGCGTRQAAQRVFVNDVIVRFHKTLELEEDELKTLICRYPPPLAPTLSSSTSHNEQANNYHLQLSKANTLEPSSDETPFELLASKPEQGQSGHIETQSENLLVAPAGGHQANQADPYRFNQIVPIQDQSADLIDARKLDNNNNNLREPSSFLERLSSVELLFMISSLMFLALLALGLLTSYFCFRRHSSRRSPKQHRASAILRQTRAANYLPGAPTATTTLRQYSQRRPQLAQYAPAKPAMSSSSSPDSDLSGRNYLLEANYSNQNHHRPYHFNQAYLHDSSPALAAPASYSRQLRHQPVLGRREAIYESSGNNSISGRRAYANYLNYGRPEVGYKQPQEPLLKLSPAHLVAAKYTLVQKNQQRRDNQQQQLLRAKSLTSVQPQVDRHAQLGSLSRHRARAELGPSRSSFQASALQYSSDSEAELNNNNPKVVGKKPTIVLKSIEDSYITKYTEIDEQEYMSRDSMKPLTLSHWLSRQPNSIRLRAAKQKQQTEDEQRYESSQTNLRSLTELDVDFAKSLLIASRPASSLRATLSADQINSSQEPTEEAQQVENAERQRSISEPEVAKSTSQTPDLILSPEYDYERLELRSPGSHNSVSYV